VTETSTRRAPALPPEERRATIVEAALPLVRRHGAAVSTRQIAEACGIAEGTIFRVFPDKEALLRQVLEAAFDPAPLLQRLSAVDPGAPLDSRLEQAVEAVQEHITGLFHLVEALGVHLRHDPARHADRGSPMARAQRAVLTALAAVVEPDRARLRRSPEDVANVVHMLTFAATHPRVAGGHPLPPSEIVSTVLDGVRARTGEPSC
jgi:AcrR family transcriptional regulator